MHSTWRFFLNCIFRDKHQVIVGDENHLTLIINARNEGEGAYEAELFVTIPEEADYVGIERSNKVMPVGDLEEERARYIFEDKSMLSHLSWGFLPR